MNIPVETYRIALIGGASLAAYSSTVSLPLFMGTIPVSIGPLTLLIPVSLSLGSSSLAFIALSIVSLPAASIAVGGGLIYYGTMSVIASIAAKSFLSLVIGLTGITSGWYLLKHHQIMPIGIGEMAISFLSK